MLKGLITLLILSFLSGRAVCETLITGRVLDQDGRPMPVANVQLLLPGDNMPLKTVAASENGRYTIAIDSTGMWLLRYAGVSHQSHEVAVYLDTLANIGIDVRLAAYQYVDTISSPGIEGNFDKYESGNPLPMHRGANGTFTADIKTTSDSIRYEVVGISRDGHAVNGTDAGRFSIDNSADYWSIVYPVNGRVRIVLDPAKLVRSDLPARVSFADSQSTVAKFAAIYDGIQAETSAFRSAVDAYRKSGRDTRNFRYDWSRQMKELQKRIDSGAKGIVRQGLLFNYLDLMTMGAEVNYRLTETALKEIPASSMIWSLNPELYELMLKEYDIAGTDYDQYIDKFIEENPNSIAKSTVLFEEFVTAKYMKEEKKAEKYYKILTQKYAGTPYGKRASENYSPLDEVQVGKPVPAFSIPTLADSTKSYTNETLKGKYYLIDFWATWCGPCVAEMQYLQKAYEEFKGKNFAMMSVSIDASPQDVMRFRKGKWPMPWDQAFAEGGWKNKMLRDFGVVAIPNPVLVDPAGKVVATGFELRSLELEATLERFLGKEKN